MVRPNPSEHTQNPARRVNMNSQSIAQQQQSWKDDPFDLKGTFKDVKTMKPQDHNKDLKDFAEELVSNNATFRRGQYDLSLYNLSEYDQNELARLFIESTGREVTECVNGDDFTVENDYTCALLDMLQNDCYETRHHFAEVTRKNIITYYANSLQEVINDACYSWLQFTTGERGLFENQDSETGEIHWLKY